MEQRRSGLGIVIIGVIVAVGLFVWAGGAWLPRAQYEAARAQHEAALAVRLNAESLNILARAGADALRADAVQSWLLSLALVALVAILVIRDRRRQAQIEQLYAVLTAMSATPWKLPAPPYTIEEVRGKLKHYEEVLR